MTAHGAHTHGRSKGAERYGSAISKLVSPLVLRLPSEPIMDAPGPQ